ATASNSRHPAARAPPMRVLVVYAHPLSDSFAAVLRDTVVQRLRAAGHDVDHCDLYAEGFDPVLTPAERRAYNTSHPDLSAVDPHVRRLCARDCRWIFLALSNIDAAGPARCARFLARVGRALPRFIGHN